MKRLMKALGEDGLDDVGRLQLEALQVEGDSEEEKGDDSEEQEESASEAEEETGEEDEGENVSDSESEKEDGKAKISRPGHQEEEDEDEVEDEEIALEDAESVDEDVVPRQKIVTNNKISLERIRDTIKLDPSLPWTETLAVTYPETINVDVDDDLNRELAFYKQALHGATTARTLAAQHSLPFTRPADYFAEMVKSDAHMERIRQTLLDENALIKRSEAKRKEREGKKYGKQVQIEKIKERERSKKDMEERLRGLKRKHKDALPSGSAQNDDEAFDVAVEDAIADRPSKRPKSSSASKQQNSKGKLSRKARDTKFGFGSGKGRRDKQNTRESTEKFDYAVGGKGKKVSTKGKGLKSKRPGKSKRAAMRSR
ncbi:EBP2_2 [Sanghuangporus weigelae]